MQTAEQVVGSFRTIGEFGPTYEVIGPVRQTSTGEAVVRIHVHGSGEECDYRYREFLDDPVAATF